MLAPVELVTTPERLGADAPVHQLHAADEWRRLIEPVTRLKARLDRVLNSRAWKANEVSADDVTWSGEQGFLCADAPSGDGVDADQFACWIVGPFRQAADSERRLARVPSWSTVGWRRRRHRAKDLADALARRAALDADTAAGADGSARWLKPLPLVICAEGKHRAELHAEFFADQLVNLEIDALPVPADLRLKRVIGAPDLLALQCRFGSHWHTALLPFPKLSLPIFAAMGVRAPRGLISGWWLTTPWCQPVRRIVARSRRQQPSAIGLALKPGMLRTAMLEAGYV